MTNKLYCRWYTGQRFGKLLVLAYVSGSASMTKWLCQCDCGKKKVVTRLRFYGRAAVVSCGCETGKLIGARISRHGGAKKSGHEPEYGSWVSMKQRCYLPSDRYYSEYGGRGIKICDRWRGEDGYANFVADMGRKPTSAHTIERNDVNKDYTPDNCRWATREEQNRNRRTSRYVEVGGRRMYFPDACREYGISRHLAEGRMRLGWSVDRAFTTPRPPKKSKGAMA